MAIAYIAAQVPGAIVGAEIAIICFPGLLLSIPVILILPQQTSASLAL